MGRLLEPVEVSIILFMYCYYVCLCIRSQNSTKNDRKRKKFSDSDRLFSRSSCTSHSVRQLSIVACICLIHLSHCSSKANRPSLELDPLHEEMSVQDSIEDISDTHSQCSTMSQEPDSSRVMMGNIGLAHTHRLKDKGIPSLAIKLCALPLLLSAYQP